jgi:hypothetical protein
MGLKRVPKVRFSHVTTHFALIPPHFCCGLRVRYAQNFAPCPLCELSGAYRIGACVNKHNELILWTFLPSLTFFGRKIGLR